MRLLTILEGVFFPRVRSTLKETARRLAESRREVQNLRERLEIQTRRLEREKRKRLNLQKRLARQHSEPPPRPLTPHRQVFGATSSTGQYCFANVVSYPKSGRTWFSTLYFNYARYLFDAQDLVQPSLHMPDRNLAFQQLLETKARGGTFPVCVFTHLGFSEQRPFEASKGSWPDKVTGVLKRPTILIIRDPRDVVVSHYHHLRAVGRVIDPDLTLSEFVRGTWGIERIVRFMNMWADALRGQSANLSVCTFEGLKRDTHGAFVEAMAFLGATIDSTAVARAVEESSFETLKTRERSNRVYQGASLETDAFRFRRGTIGGYAKELSEADTEYLDKIVATQLDHAFSAYHMTAIRAVDNPTPLGPSRF